MKKIALALLFLTTFAAAQAQKFRPANESDFVGYWRIQLVPNEMHRSELKNELTGYADPCQFFIHRQDGAWFNFSTNIAAGVEETKRRCPNMKRADVDLALYSIGNQTPYRWRKKQGQDGLFGISDPSKPESKMLLWKADAVLVDIPESAAQGYDFKKGDLLMQLTKVVNATTITAIWPMVLRPVTD